MKQINFWQEIQDNLNKFGRLALAVVYDADHSTPGRAGFKMFVTPEGSPRGSVGGGKVEGMVIDECKELYNKDSSKNYYKEYKLLGEAPESIGMICNGVQIIGFLMLEKKDVNTIEKIINASNLHKESSLIVTKNSFEYSGQPVRDTGFDANKGVYTERIGGRKRVYVFGGGHVGLAISKVMSRIDFKVVVIDNRKYVETLKENKFADEIIIDDFVKATDTIIEDAYSYIVIVTPGHLQDKDVLRAVLKKNVKYIGMMGSESKVRTLYKELKVEGIDPKLLERIHSPIGLKIKSETPDEIAISIAAEIIKIKNT
ncbi:MAG: XdhC family protein [Candidatus Kapaibacterium sp.]